MQLSEIKDIISTIKYKDWEFLIFEENGINFIQIQFVDKCACGRDVDMLHKCRKWRISPNITKSELVQTAFLAVSTAEEHEMRENFKYKGAAIFAPHYDVDKLLDVYNDKKFDMRTNSFDIQ